MLIRDTIEADLPAILEIHNEAVRNSTAIWNTREVDLANRAALLAERRARNFAFLTAEIAGHCIGYASFGEFRPHEGYYLTVEHSVYVHRDARGKGAARALMLRLMDAARTSGKHLMIGGIEAENRISIALHEKLGFQETGRLPEVGFKFGRFLDLVFMQKKLN